MAPEEAACSIRNKQPSQQHHTHTPPPPDHQRSLQQRWYGISGVTTGVRTKSAQGTFFLSRVRHEGAERRTRQPVDRSACLVFYSSGRHNKTPESKHDDSDACQLAQQHRQRYTQKKQPCTTQGGIAYSKPLRPSGSYFSRGASSRNYPSSPPSRFPSPHAAHRRSRATTKQLIFFLSLPLALSPFPSKHS